jgi:hypothetical protein
VFTSVYYIIRSLHATPAFAPGAPMLHSKYTRYSKHCPCNTCSPALYASKLLSRVSLPDSSMTRLTPLLLEFLRKLLSSALIKGSIKRLLFLFDFIRRQFSIKRTPNGRGTPSTPRSQSIGFAVGDVICPNLQPPLRPADQSSLHVPDGSNEPYVKNSIYSPSPVKATLLPFAYDTPGARSSQDITTWTMGEHNIDTMTSRRPGGPPSTSVLSLPLSQHGLVLKSPPRSSSRNSQRPDSRNPRPLKVSRPPSTAPSFNRAYPVGATAPPDFPRSRFLHQSATLRPISTASIQRWSRNHIVYVLPIKCFHDSEGSWHAAPRT